MGRPVIDITLAKTSEDGIQEFNLVLLQMDRLQLTAVYCIRRGGVKTTPQMTRFRDVKVCNNLVTDEIDDHRIQSGYKCTIGLQYPERKHYTLGIAYAW